MMYKRNKADGVTLISILVGMSLGTFIIVVMLQIFSTTRSNLNQSENLSEMNNVLRYASIVMTNIISQSGYTTVDSGSGALPAYTSIFQPFTSTWYGPSASTYDPNQTNADDPSGVTISYFPGQNVILSAGNVDNGDKFWVKFTGDAKGTIRDCNDIYGVNNAPIKVLFYSRTTTINGIDSTGYYCERHDDLNDYTYDNATITGTELIPAELFDTAWIRYGEDITNSGYIDRWALGQDVVDRTKVYAVRVAFLIHSRDDLRNDPVTKTFNVFGQTITRTDKKLYKLYMFTIPLAHAPNYAGASLVTVP